MPPKPVCFFTYFSGEGFSVRLLNEKADTSMGCVDVEWTPGRERILLKSVASRGDPVSTNIFLLSCTVRSEVMMRTLSKAVPRVTLLRYGDLLVSQPLLAEARAETVVVRTAAETRDTFPGSRVPENGPQLIAAAHCTTAAGYSRAAAAGGQLS